MLKKTKSRITLIYKKSNPIFLKNSTGFHEKSRHFLEKLFLLKKEVLNAKKSIKDKDKEQLLVSAHLIRNKESGWIFAIKYEY